MGVDSWKPANKLANQFAAHETPCINKAYDTMVAAPSCTIGAHMVNDLQRERRKVTPVTHAQTFSQNPIQRDHMMKSGHLVAHERKRGRRGSKLWCHLYMGEQMLLDGFDLVPMIIGRGGMNLRNIFEKTGVKIRVRGRGSGHHERDSSKEADAHLMIALSADNGKAQVFEQAFRDVVEVVRMVADRFDKFCRRSHQRVPPGRLFWVGDAGGISKCTLCNLLNGALTVAGSAGDGGHDHASGCK